MTERPQEPASSLTPREIVSELDRDIIGQQAAKRAVAIAMRHRWRRQRLPEEMRAGVSPKNIILIGPTGVGKTEIARRLAKLTRAPFVKVEASSYTQVGYVGRDVESMIRDLAESAYALQKSIELDRLSARASGATRDRLLDLLLPQRGADPSSEESAREQRSREKLGRRLDAGELEDREVEVDVKVSQPAPTGFAIPGLGGPSGGAGFDLGGLFEKLGAGTSKRRRLKLSAAREALRREEAEKLLDDEKLRAEALRRTENQGIVFIDEIDKICARAQKGSGPDVSGEGVQRDLLPVVEGSHVQTRLGTVKTDHILFIAAGAFHVAKPSDLIPELQGRFPIRVELSPLRRADLRRILCEPRDALARQYVALLATEGLTLELADSALDAVAELAESVNTQVEDIGARRLHTIMEKLLEDALFDAPDQRGQSLSVDRLFVEERLRDIVDSKDLSRYIL